MLNDDIEDNDLSDNNNIAPKIISQEEVKRSMETIVDYFNNRRYNEKEVNTVCMFKNFEYDALTSNLVQGTFSFKKINF